MEEVDKVGEVEVKRSRKKNWSESEISELLSEVRCSSELLFSKDISKVTVQQKERRWREIAERITLCGVAVREWKEVKEKLKKIKFEVLARQREIVLGEENPPPPLPFEEEMLEMLGYGTNSFTMAMDGDNNSADMTDMTTTPCTYDNDTEGDFKNICKFSETVATQHSTPKSVALKAAIARNRLISKWKKREKWKQNGSPFGPSSSSRGPAGRDVWTVYLESEIAKNAVIVRQLEADIVMKTEKAKYYSKMADMVGKEMGPHTHSDT